MSLILRNGHAAFLYLIILIAATVFEAFGQSNIRSERYLCKDVMIPMRDGVNLHTKVFELNGTIEAVPILLLRTPYGISDSYERLETVWKNLADENYIFVFQDIRGKFGSEGVFVMQRPARSHGDSLKLDEGTDTYDTIDWLLKNINHHNGRVGMVGVSYLGWTAIMGALEPHSALKAISTQASPADMWLGDDFHHNGAFRLSYGFEYAYWLESGNDLKDFAFNRYDTYTWYLDLGSLANVNKHIFLNKVPTWNDYVAHPNYDDFWKRQTVIPHIQAISVPTLNVAGWWDQEDFYGPLAIYQALEKYDTTGINNLVVGPWNHGGWRRGSGDQLGPISFDQSTGKYFRHQVEARWFAYYLKGKHSLDFPEALTFESGTNCWRRWKSWPPTYQTKEQSLYFGPDKRLLFTVPETKTKNIVDEFVSDPAHPVPYRQRPIQATYFPGGSNWDSWLVEDQRFVDQRGDVLSWESLPLESALTIAGEIFVHLFASTSGSDADWIVKLIDVYPEHYPENWSLAGYQLMVSNEVFRGRYRKSYEKPEAIEPGKVLEYSFSLHTQNYSFKKGHRIMVQVQSTWFPIIDRNPQTYIPNIFEAKEKDFIKQVHSIYRSSEYPSHISLPVVISDGIIE